MSGKTCGMREKCATKCVQGLETSGEFQFVKKEFNFGKHDLKQIKRN